MTLTGDQLLFSYAHQLEHGKTYYTKPSPDKMVDILKNVYQHKISRRTFFRTTHDLEEEGYIRRQVRYHPKARPKIIQLSSMALLRLKAVNYLKRKGLPFAYKLFKMMTDFLKHFQPLVSETVTEYNERTLELIDDEYNLKKVREVLVVLEQYEKDKRRKKCLRLHI